MSIRKLDERRVSAYPDDSAVLALALTEHGASVDMRLGLLGIRPSGIQNITSSSNSFRILGRGF